MLKFDRVILSIILAVFFTVSQSTSLVAQETGSTNNGNQIQYGIGIKYFYLTKKENVYFKRYPREAEEYIKPGDTVICIVKNSPASEVGLSLYDKIIEVNNQKNPDYKFVNDNPVKVKYIRNGKVLDTTIKPRKITEINFKNITCNKEFAIDECRTKFSDVKQEDYYFLEKVYECFKTKGIGIIPFVKNDEYGWEALEAFIFTFGYYIFDKPNVEKLKYFIKQTKEYINEVEAFLQNDNPSEDDKKKASDLKDALVERILLVNSHIADDRFKNNKFDLESNQFAINKIKEKISNISDYKDKNNLNFLIKNYTYLSRAGFNNFINLHWKKAIEKIDWQLKENIFYIEIYLDYVDNLFKSKNFENGILTLQNLEEKIIQFNKDKDFILVLRKIYSKEVNLGLSELFTNHANALKRNEKLAIKIEKNYLNFQKLNELDKKYVLTKDKDFVEKVYDDLSSIFTSLGSHKKSIEYADLLLELISNNKQKFEEDKLPIYVTKFQSLASLGFLDDAINTYYDFKNSALKSINSKSGQINLLIYSPSMIQYLYKIGLYEEAKDLVDLVNTNFNLKSKSAQWYDNINADIFKLHEALLYKKKQNYSMAIEVLENIYKKCDLSSKEFAMLWNNCAAHAHLLELYYKTGKIKKFEALYQEKMGNSLKNEKIENLIFYSENLLPEYNLGLFKIILDYYKSNNNLEKYNQLASESLKITNKILSNHKSLVNNKRVLISFDIYQGLAQLGSYLVEKKHTDGLLMLNTLSKEITDAYINAKFNTPVSTNTKATEIISSYLTAASIIKNDEFTKESYKLYQVLRNSITSKDIKKAIVRKLYVNSKKYELIKKYQDYETLLSSYYKKDDFNLNWQNKDVSNNSGFSKISKDDKIKSEFIADELKKLSKEINKNFPEYNSLTKLEPVDVYKIQNKLTKEDAVLDYYFDHENVFVFAITKEKFSIFKNKFPIKEQEKLQSLIRNSLTVSSSGTLGAFNIEASHQIYQSTFQFFEKFIQNKKNIFVIPDGLLQNIPLNILVDQNGKNCSNCSNVRWLMAKYNFSYLPSIDFIHFKSKDEKNNNQYAKQYMGIGDPVLGVNNNKDDGSRVEIAKFLNRGASSFVANTKEIKKIYGKVEGSGDEIKTVASYFNNNQVSILLNENASETKVKSENLNIYKIIHFATHGEISGAIKGYNEPFLVLTPPDKGTDQDDGLLTMTEIMQLENNAEIVILSACNTATGDKKNSDGFSGLARAFLFSGSKSVMVSNWYVETFSAKELIINFMSGLTKNKETSPVSLKNTMMNFIKAHPDKSHPFYWAPFVVVGAI